MKRLVALMCLAGLAGCSMGPDYVRPTVDVPERFKEASGNDARGLAGAPQQDWWRSFGDPVLDELEAQLSHANLDVLIAQAQYRAALASARGARSSLLPSVAGQIGSSRSESSRDTARGGPQSNYLLGFSAAWELDVWGRLGRQAEAGTLVAEASAADLAGVRLSVQAELARLYFLLRVSDAQRLLLEGSVAAYEKSLALAKNRLAAGVATPLDVAQAETQWKSTQAQLVDLGVQRGQLEHAIAVLLGRVPNGFSIAPAPLLAQLPDIPAGLPARLLERRPDIAAAERRAAAANAQIGAAKAAFFPAVNLTASVGSESPSFSRWLSGPSQSWSFGTAIIGSLFDGGARDARVQQAEASSDASVAAYRQVVLQAFQEVEDSLSGLRLLAEEAGILAEAQAAAKRSEELTGNLYRLGTVSYLNVVAAQTAALNSERSALDVLSRRLTACVALIKALGGGWSRG